MNLNTALFKILEGESPKTILHKRFKSSEWYAKILQQAESTGFGDTTFNNTYITICYLKLSRGVSEAKGLEESAPWFFTNKLYRENISKLNFASGKDLYSIHYYNIEDPRSGHLTGCLIGITFDILLKKLDNI